jgi:hypothetical protein
VIGEHLDRGKRADKNNLTRFKTIANYYEYTKDEDGHRWPGSPRSLQQYHPYVHTVCCSHRPVWPLPGSTIALASTPSVPKYKVLESSNSRNNSERKWLLYPSFYTTNQLSNYSPTSFNFVLSFQDLIFWHKIWTLQDPIFWDGGSRWICDHVRFNRSSLDIFKNSCVLYFQIAIC